MIVRKFFIGILGLQKTITLIIHDYFLKFFLAIFKLKPVHQFEAYAPTHIIILLQSLTFYIFVINFNKNLINGIKIIIFDIVKLNPPQKKKQKRKPWAEPKWDSTLACISCSAATSSSISFNRFFMSSTSTPSCFNHFYFRIKVINDILKSVKKHK